MSYVDLKIMGLTEYLGIGLVEASDTCVVMDMPITPELLQPARFLHGGATATLLESAASWACFLRSDEETELPFGTELDIRHRKPGVSGTVRGTAELEREEDLGRRGRKQIWSVVAVDDGGDVISQGTMVTRIVTKEYFDSKQRAAE